MGRSIVSVAGISLSLRAPLDVRLPSRASTRVGVAVAVGFDGTDVPEDVSFPTSYKDANGAVWEYVRESAVAFIRVYGKTTAYRGAASPWMYNGPFFNGPSDADDEVKKWIDGFVNTKKKLGESAFSAYGVSDAGSGVDEYGVPPVPTNEPPAGLTNEPPAGLTSEGPTASAPRSYAAPLAIGFGLVVAVIAVAYFA